MEVYCAKSKHFGVFALCGHLTPACTSLSVDYAQ